MKKNGRSPNQSVRSNTAKALNAAYVSSPAMPAPPPPAPTQTDIIMSQLGHSIETVGSMLDTLRAHNDALFGEIEKRNEAVGTFPPAGVFDRIQNQIAQLHALCEGLQAEVARAVRV